MPYVLGIHLGATATSAAIAQREGSRWAAPVPLPLGSAGPRASATVPTVLCRVQDGSFLAGETARDQELSHHEWVVRCFTRRVGDDHPLLVGNDFVPAQRLVATMVEWVADTVAHRQGHPPEHIAIAHSVSWGPYRVHLVQQALRALGLNDVTLVPEPLAVGLDYAGKQRIEENATLAVGNIGGTGFDATVLRRRHPGFEIAGAPLDSAHPSGQDLDDALVAHVQAELGARWEMLDQSDLNIRFGLARVRAECVRTREALSYHPHAAVHIELPELRTDVPLTRSRYEQLAKSHLERVPDLLLQVIQSANLTSDQLDAVVLAGGTARTPLLKQLVTQRFQQAPLIDGVPELVAAAGAAQAAVNAVSAVTDRAVSVAETSVLMRIEGNDSGQFEPVEEEPEVPRPSLDVEPMYIEPPDERRERMIKILKLTAAALLILLGLYLTFHPLGGQPTSPGLFR